MLVNTFGKKINASSVVKDSAFYIEVAKFVQAYTVILNSPNDFLSEVGEQNIDESKDKLSWTQVVKIMTTCNFGFNETPTESDLLVYFNYAIEIGSISKKEKTFASVDDIADAQNNYYLWSDSSPYTSLLDDYERVQYNNIFDQQHVDNDIFYIDGVIPESFKNEQSEEN